MIALNSLRKFSNSSSPSSRRVLITGAKGQIARNLIPLLLKTVPPQNILATDLDTSAPSIYQGVAYTPLDATDLPRYAQIFKQFEPTHVLSFAAILSAKGELDPLRTWDVNNSIFLNSIQLCLPAGAQLLHPSSIAAYGGAQLQRDGTPDDHEKLPETIYGCTKVASEVVGNYYHAKHGLDYRALRYPAVISSEKFEAGGSLSYPQELFYAVGYEGKKEYEIYLRPDSTGPIIHIEDTLIATRDLMFADGERLTRRCYNVNGYAACPRDFVEWLEKKLKEEGRPAVKVTYKSEERRQKIVDSWANYVDDGPARRDWGWRVERSFESLCEELWARAKEGF